MKKLLVLLTAVCALSGSYMQVTAQSKSGDIRIEWGSDIPLPKKHTPFSFVGNTGDGFVQIAVSGKKQISLIKIGTDLTEKNLITELLPQSKYSVLEYSLEIGERAFLLFSDYDKNANSEKLIIREIDLKKGTFKGEPGIVIETDDKVLFKEAYRKSMFSSISNKFHVVLPDNGDRFMVYYTKRPDFISDKKNFEKLVYTVFDFNFNKLWSREVEMPIVENDFQIQDHAIIDDDVFIFAETKSGQTLEKITQKPTFDQLTVLKFTEGETPLQSKELVLDNNSHIKEFALGKGNGGKMLISGYYKPEKKTKIFTGYFTAVFNPEKMKLENLKKYPLEDDLIKAFEKERTRRKLEKEIERENEIGIPHLVMRNLLKRSDGGWYLIGEQHFTKISSTYEKNYTKYTIRYFFLDVIVSSIDASGNQQWIKKIPKNQMSIYTTYGKAYGLGHGIQVPHEYYITSNYGSGISSFVYEDNLYLFYLDSEKNKGIDESQVQASIASFKGSYLAAVKFNPDGEKKSSAVYDLRDEEMKVISPTTLKWVGDGVLLSASRAGTTVFSKKSNTPAYIYLK